MAWWSGASTSASGWRGIFLVNLPVCVVAITLILGFVTRSTSRSVSRLDLPGLVLGTAGLAGLTGGCIELGKRAGTRPGGAVLVVLGLGVLALFCWWEARATEPMLPLSVFRRTRFGAGTCADFLFNFSLYGMLLCLSLALQDTFRLDPWATGLAILPLTAAVGVGSTVSGPLTGRIGPRIPMLAGYTCAALGALLVAVAGVHASLPLMVAGSTLLGLCSLAMPAMTAADMAAADPAATGVASGVLKTARQTGGALGVAALGALFAASGTGQGLVLPGLGAATASLLAIGATLPATARPT